MKIILEPEEFKRIINQSNCLSISLPNRDIGEYRSIEIFYNDEKLTFKFHFGMRIEKTVSIPISIIYDYDNLLHEILKKRY